MANFKSGYPPAAWESIYCFRCTHDREQTLKDCPILSVHALFEITGYGQTQEDSDAAVVKEILEVLIPSSEEGTPGECPMFVPALPDEAERLFEASMQRWLATRK